MTNLLLFQCLWCKRQWYVPWNLTNIYICPDCGHVIEVKNGEDDKTTMEGQQNVLPIGTKAGTVPLQQR